MVTTRWVAVVVVVAVAVIAPGTARWRARGRVFFPLFERKYISIQRSSVTRLNAYRDLVSAQKAVDIWALGVLVYEMLVRVCVSG